METVFVNIEGRRVYWMFLLHKRILSSYHIRFWYLRCCGCPGLRGRQHLATPHTLLHEFLSNGLTPSRLHIVISFLTHADHVFLGLPRSLVPGSPNCVMELMHKVARCTCLRRRERRTGVISWSHSLGNLYAPSLNRWWDDRNDTWIGHY